MERKNAQFFVTIRPSKGALWQKKKKHWTLRDDDWEKLEIRPCGVIGLTRQMILFILCFK